MYGLAYGDAISFPSMFYRFRVMHERRRAFLWRTNAELDSHNIARLTLPFTHRDESVMMEPCPTDDTEFAFLCL